MERYWLICYDVADPKRLRKIAKIMQSYGVRAQKSVFECWLSDARLAELKEQTDKIIETEDDVRYYTLCETCRRLTHSKTETELRTNERFYIV